MSANLVTIRALRVTLGGKPILQGIDTSIARGRVTAIIGLNGSGKTTLLRTLLGEVPYSGQIEFQCAHSRRGPGPEHIGYVPQRLHIDARLPITVRDLLALALQRTPLFLGISRRTQTLMRQLLDRVWAPAALLDRPVEKLSGGELQRVLLALALHPQPELLLLDEPATGIDFRDEEKFYELIGDLNRRTAVTVILVSHDLSVVSTHAQHVLCLKDGRIRCEGPPREVLSGDMLTHIFGSDKGLFVHAHEE
ncbi:MAG: metal ABC transporter ATP-binding protein [Gemmataceae bacterium]